MGVGEKERQEVEFRQMGLVRTRPECEKLAWHEAREVGKSHITRNLVCQAQELRFYPVVKEGH